MKGTIESPGSLCAAWQGAVGSGRTRSQQDKGQTRLLVKESPSYVHQAAEPRCSPLCWRTRDRVSPFLPLEQRRLQLLLTFSFQLASPLSSQP